MTYVDPAFNSDGSWNQQGYEAELARTPKREEVGLHSVWEFYDTDKFPGAWKVEKINPRTIVLVNPTGAKLRTDVMSLRRTELKFVAVENVFRPHTGAVVTPVRDLGPRGPQSGTAYVVLKTVGLEEVQLAEMNGDGKYWTRIPIKFLQKFTGTVKF